MKKLEFYANGMHCGACEKTISTTVKKLPGIKKVDVDYVTEKVNVTYDTKKISEEDIFETVNNKGYTSSFEKIKKRSISTYIMGMTFLVIGAVILFRVYTHISIPAIDPENVGILLVLIIGLITGLHCVSMCGGIVLSYTAKSENKSKIIPHLKYGIGKTTSYAIMGGLFGILGSFITFTPQIKALTAIIAGLFLMIFGLNMLNIFPFLRKIRLTGPNITTKSNNPLIIGAANGLMLACGPLQAMYILAASIGGFWNGFILLATFGLGTLPALFGFGYAASYMSHGVKKHFLKFSGVLIIILGIIMVNRGLAIGGTGYNFDAIKEKAILATTDNQNDASIVLENGYQVIEMHVTNRGWEPDKFVLKKDIPTKWKIYGDQINGCNNEIVVKEYGLRIPVKPGLQEITFTPDKEKVVSWSCWMGMIPGTFIVKTDVDSSNIDSILESVPTPKPSGGSCGMGGSGGCGCGRR